MSLRDDEPSPKQPAPLPAAEEADPTSLTPSAEIPSRRSLGDDPTSLVNIGAAAEEKSVTALLLVPEPRDAEPKDIEPSDTALIVVPESSGTDSLLSAQPKTLPAVERPAAITNAKTLPPDGSVVRLDRDATQVRKNPLGENTALLHVGQNEPSLGARITNPAGIALDETEMRQVFARLSEKSDSGRLQRQRLATLRTEKPPRSLLAAPGLWIALAAILLLGLGGWNLHAWHAQRQRHAALVADTRAALLLTHQRGQLSDFATAETRLRALLNEQPSDGPALSARALVLSEALYEFGGGPDIPLGTSPAGAADSSNTEAPATWAAEAQGAVRKTQGEKQQVAVAAQVFLALAHADLKEAERALLQLTAAPASAAAQGDLAPLPAGLADYLSSQVALVGGKDAAALEALRSAVTKNPLPLWQRRLGYLLYRGGHDAEALPHLIAVEQHQPELCGGRIDLAFLRGRAGDGRSLRTARPLLRSFVDPPPTGPDPCGRGERARAALLSAELTLREEPTARGEARALLDKAEMLAPPEDVVLADALVEARLRTGDSQKAEQLARAALEHVATRRSTRLLLTQALLRSGQGTEALAVLEPLALPTDSAAAPPAAAAATDKGVASTVDVEALLFRAQALLQLNDTLEAQRLARRILSGNPSPAVRTDAQLLLSRVYLQLQEPAAARRVLEPLFRLASAGNGNTADGGIHAEQRLDIQVLWAQTLLAARPPEQSEARALLEAVLGQAPERVEARLLLGRLLRELSELGQAEQQLNAALRTDDHYTPARRELAALLMQRGDFAKAHALYRQLVTDEKDPELLLASARAERLDGAPEQALASLANIKRGRGEVVSKYDEALLAERARDLLALERPGEAEALLHGPGSDLQGLRRPTLAALLIRATVVGLVGPQRAAPIAQARALLSRMPPAWRTDFDVRFAEAELLIAEENPQAARPLLESLTASLQTIPPSSGGEEVALRHYAERLLSELPAGPAAVTPHAPDHR